MPPGQIDPGLGGILERGQPLGRDRLFALDQSEGVAGLGRQANSPSDQIELDHRSAIEPDRPAQTGQFVFGRPRDGKGQ